MNIRRVVALAGPNIWTNYKALEAWVDIGKFEDFPSNTLPGFPERIMQWLPTMIEHRCGIGERGGFFQRLRTGTYLGHILEHVTLELQSLAGVAVDFGRARETSERGVYKVVIEFTEENFARASMKAAERLIRAAIEDDPFDVAEEVRKLRVLAEEVCLGPGTRSIVEAATARQIPHLRLNTGSLVQLGYCSAQRRIWAAETGGTSAVAESIAQDKQLTRQLLLAVGVPVPQGQAVCSKDEAWEAAQDIGLPVVIKPQDGNYGRGVSVNLVDEASIRAAYEYAAREGSGVLVERMILGHQIRVLVIDDKVVAASQGDPDHVVGDGVHSIAELVEFANKQPIRRYALDGPLSPMFLDDIAISLLHRQGYSEESVPTQGQQVIIHYNGDLTDDVTDRVHPEVAADCVLAARTVGLNIAGIDLIANRVDEPLAPQAGAILEVNASPGLLMHLKPLNGKPRPVGEAIVSALFKDGENGRVPLVAVTGTNGKTSTVRLVEQILAVSGKKVGVACSDGVRVEGRNIAKGQASDAPSARRLLVNPFINAVVLEVSAASVLNQGLGFDRCDVAVVTNLGSGDHLGATYVESIDVMTKVKRTPVDVVLPHGAAVLNADDPVIAGLSGYCPGETIFFGRSMESPRMRSAINAGLRVVTIDHGNLSLVQGQRATTVMASSAIPHSDHGTFGFQLENAMAAAGAAWALGIAPSQIAAGLLQAGGCPASIALFGLRDSTIVVSQCRNLSALDATLSAINVASISARRRVLCGVHDDIRAQDAAALGRRLGEEFDEVVFGSYSNEGIVTDAALLDAFEAAARQGLRIQTVQRLEHEAHLSTLNVWLKDSERPQLVLFQARNSSAMSEVINALCQLGAAILVGESASAAAVTEISNESTRP